MDYKKIYLLDKEINKLKDKDNKSKQLLDNIIDEIDLLLEDEEDLYSIQNALFEIKTKIIEFNLVNN